MHILLAVDYSDSHKPVLDCLAALKLPDPKLDVLNVVQPIPSYDTTVLAVSAISTEGLVQMLDSTCAEAREHACADAIAKGFEVKSMRGDGYPSQVIVDTAAETGIDLIALGADPKGSVPTFFVGSTAQAVVTAARQSVLVVRSGHPFPERIRAVFATDHSAYADKALETLISWRPGGFEHIEVLTAYKTHGHEHVNAGREQPFAPWELDNMIRAKLCEKTGMTAERLRGAGINADARVERGDVRQAIEKTMKETRSDLLILGARGHGLLDRVFLGSTTTHQLIAEPYSLLVIRPVESGS